VLLCWGDTDLIRSSKYLQASLPLYPCLIQPRRGRKEQSMYVSGWVYLWRPRCLLPCNDMYDIDPFILLNSAGRQEGLNCKLLSCSHRSPLYTPHLPPPSLNTLNTEAIEKPQSRCALVTINLHTLPYCSSAAETSTALVPRNIETWYNGSHGHHVLFDAQPAASMLVNMPHSIYKRSPGPTILLSHVIPSPFSLSF
jgi:hypothetical protein